MALKQTLQGERSDAGSPATSSVMSLVRNQQWRGTKILLMEEILHQLRLVVYPIFSDVLYIQTVVVVGFLNYQQYHQINNKLQTAEEL